MSESKKGVIYKGMFFPLWGGAILRYVKQPIVCAGRSAWNLADNQGRDARCGSSC